MKRVVSIAWGVVRNSADAEDLAQEAFVKAFENIGRFKIGEPFGPWIYRIVTNLGLDVMKHRKRFRHEEITDSAPAARGDRADLPAISNELAERIDRGIESLPEMQRIVARLYLVEEFGHAEIAKMTGLSEGTVRSHLSLARGKLKEKLADLHGGSNDCQRQLPRSPSHRCAATPLRAGRDDVHPHRRARPRTHRRRIGHRDRTNPGALVLPRHRIAGHARRRRAPRHPVGRTISRRVSSLARFDDE